QHHDDLEAVELFRADKRVLEPAPTALAVELLDALLPVHLKSRVGERAIGFDGVLRARQRSHLLNPALRDKVIGLDEIARSPDDARGECFGIHFRAEFDRPLYALRILDADFGIRAPEILLLECEWLLGRIVTATHTAHKIQTCNIARIVPNDRRSGWRLCIRSVVLLLRLCLVHR